MDQTSEENRMDIVGSNGNEGLHYKLPQGYSRVPNDYTGPIYLQSQIVTAYIAINELQQQIAVLNKRLEYQTHRADANFRALSECIGEE
jgi:hypothetical protein